MVFNYYTAPYLRGVSAPPPIFCTLIDTYPGIFCDYLGLKISHCMISQFYCTPVTIKFLHNGLWGGGWGLLVVLHCPNQYQLSRPYLSCWSLTAMASQFFNLLSGEWGISCGLFPTHRTRLYFDESWSFPFESLFLHNLFASFSDIFL